eukprot:1084188-Amphidinium_carterae.1
MAQADFKLKKGIMDNRAHLLEWVSQAMESVSTQQKIRMPCHYTNTDAMPSHQSFGSGLNCTTLHMLLRHNVEN